MKKISILSAKVGWRGSFCLLKRGEKEEDDGTIKQDELRECALMRPTGRAKRWPNASYIAPIGRRGQTKTRCRWVSYQEGKSGKCTYDNVHARKKRIRRVIYRSKLPCALSLNAQLMQGATKAYEKASDLTKKRRWPVLADHRLRWVRITIPTAEASTHIQEST